MRVETETKGLFCFDRKDFIRVFPEEGLFKKPQQETSGKRKKIVYRPSDFSNKKMNYAKKTF